MENDFPELTELLRKQRLEGAMDAVQQHLPRLDSIERQLREVQKSLNTSTWILGAIAVLTAIAAFS